MIAYHVDIKCSLRPNIPICLQSPYLNREDSLFWNELFPEGVSVFGFSVMKNHKLNSEPLFMSQLINEFCFEYVRRCKYPDMPSRFQSFFTCESIKDTKEWIRILNLHYLKPLQEPKKNPPVIWKVEIPDNSIGFDVTWRDIIPPKECPVSFNFFDSYKRACQYWSGIKYHDPAAPIEIVTRLRPRDSCIRILERIVP
jgi:hypothetical protein